MKRLFPWLLSLGFGLSAVSCSPKNSVKPGAPVLTTVTLVESGGPTNLTGTEETCGGTVGDGKDCDPTMALLCRSPSSYCRCQGTDMMDMTKGAWNCLFEPTTGVVLTFDRLLDTAPLDYDMTMPPMGRTDLASFMASQGTTPDALVDYASNGASDSLIFKLFSGITGPRLFISGNPGLPSGAALTLTVDKTKVRAKDHVSFFVGEGAFKDGVITFATAPLSVGVDVPVAPPPDGGGTDALDDDGGVDGGTDGGGTDAATDAGSDAAPVDVGADDVASVEVSAEVGVEAGTDVVAADAGTDAEPPPPPPAPVMAGMQVVTVSFNNLTDPDKITKQITVTKDGAPYADVTIKPTDDGGTRVYAVAPATSWPAGATIVVTVSADAADIQGVKLGAAASGTFVTEP